MITAALAILMILAALSCAACAAWLVIAPYVLRQDPMAPRQRPDIGGAVLCLSVGFCALILARVALTIGGAA